MKRSITLLPTLLLLLALMFLSAFDLPVNKRHPLSKVSGEPLKEQAFRILDAKCNVCHRKQNPFMVFNLNNMDRRAPRIYRAVFVDKRMPKGNTIQLKAEEYATLEQWLITKIDQ